MNSPLPLRTTAYRGQVTNTDRWNGFAARDSDIFICTPDKCGTTWTQAICAMLIFGRAEFETKVSHMSPWLDAEMMPVEAMLSMLEAQTHRRFLKTHTPLDGIPYYQPCTYLAVYRDPRDVYFSMRSHIENMNSDVFDSMVDGDVREGFRRWAREPHVPGTRERFNLEAITHHYLSFRRFSGLPNMHLFHYADMKRDRKAAMERIASALGIETDDATMTRLADAASFEGMKANAEQFAPGVGMGIWKDDSRFFNKGSSNQWRDVLTADDLAIYEARIRALLPAEDIAWLQDGGIPPAQ